MRGEDAARRGIRGTGDGAVSTWRFNPKTWQVVYAPSNMPATEVRVLEHFLPPVTTRTANSR